MRVTLPIAGAPADSVLAADQPRPTQPQR